MNKQQTIEKCNQEFQDKLKCQVFPEEQLPQDFNHWKHVAFQYESIFSIQKAYQLSFDQYKVLLMKEKDFTLYEVAIISNSIEQRTPAEISHLIGQNYYDVQQKIYEINQAWKAIVDPMREETERRIAIMNNGSIPMAQRGLNIINGKKR